MEWTEELIINLRALWDEGRSTAEIGRMIGMSKNAVVGKAHRLNLAQRPSPIRREPGAQKVRPRPLARGRTLPPLAAVRIASAPDVPAPGPVLVPRVALEREPEAGGSVPGAGVRQAEPARPARGREMACCWPLGEPGTAGFHFCGALAAPGKPYCVAHAQVAYVRVRDRREDAA